MLHSEKERIRIPMSDLKPGIVGIVDEIALPESQRRLLSRIGFFVGAEVVCSRHAPLGGPIIYSLEGSEVALRADTARHILISLNRLQPTGASRR